MAEMPEDREGPHAFPSLTIDWDCYAQHLDGADLTDDQKRELIETLWGIVVACVDLGFDLRPCEQNCETAPCSAADLLSLAKDIPDNHHQTPDAHGRHDPAGKEDS